MQRPSVATPKMVLRMRERRSRIRLVLVGVVVFICIYQMNSFWNPMLQISQEEIEAKALEDRQNELKHLRESLDKIVQDVQLSPEIPGIPAAAEDIDEVEDWNPVESKLGFDEFMIGKHENDVPDDIIIGEDLKESDATVDSQMPFEVKPYILKDDQKIIDDVNREIQVPDNYGLLLENVKNQGAFLSQEIEDNRVGLKELSNNELQEDNFAAESPIQYIQQEPEVENGLLNDDHSIKYNLLTNELLQQDLQRSNEPSENMVEGQLLDQDLNQNSVALEALPKEPILDQYQKQDKLAIGDTIIESPKDLIAQELIASQDLKKEDTVGIKSPPTVLSLDQDLREVPNETMSEQYEKQNIVKLDDRLILESDIVGLKSLPAKLKLDQDLKQENESKEIISPSEFVQNYSPNEPISEQYWKQEDVVIGDALMIESPKDLIGNEIMVNQDLNQEDNVEIKSLSSELPQKTNLRQDSALLNILSPSEVLQNVWPNEPIPDQYGNVEIGALGDALIIESPEDLIAKQIAVNEDLTQDPVALIDKQESPSHSQASLLERQDIPENPSPVVTSNNEISPDKLLKEVSLRNEANPEGVAYVGLPINNGEINMPNNVIPLNPELNKEGAFNNAMPIYEGNKEYLAKEALLGQNNVEQSAAVNNGDEKVGPYTLPEQSSNSILIKSSVGGSHINDNNGVELTKEFPQDLDQKQNSASIGTLISDVKQSPPDAFQSQEDKDTEKSSLIYDTKEEDGTFYGSSVYEAKQAELGRELPSSDVLNQVIATPKALIIEAKHSNISSDSLLDSKGKEETLLANEYFNEIDRKRKNFQRYIKYFDPKGTYKTLSSDENLVENVKRNTDSIQFQEVQKVAEIGYTSQEQLTQDTLVNKFINSNVAVQKEKFPGPSNYTRTQDIHGETLLGEETIEPEFSRTGHLADWTEAAGSEGIIYVYSAYLDRRRPQHVIRMVALIVTKETFYVECTYWTVSQKQTTQRAQIKEIVDRIRRYKSVYILCPVSENDPKDWIQRVTVSNVIGKSKDYEQSMPVDHFDARRKLGELNVCVKVMPSGYNNAAVVAEFIEMYKLLGADSFFFYNNNIGPDLEALLQHYKEQGLVEILPWTLFTDYEEDVHRSGVYASLNDCGLRSVNHFPLTAVLDLDEYIIPRRRNHQTLLDVVRHQGDYDAYIFKNVFFYLEWEDDPTPYQIYSIDYTNGLEREEKDKLHLITQGKTRRSMHYLSVNRQAKYVMRPERVIEPGNHFIREFVDINNTENRTGDVAVDVAFCQHYSSCEKDNLDQNLDDCLAENSVVDRTAHRFMMPLVRAVSTVCRTLFPALPTCPAA